MSSLIDTGTTIDGGRSLQVGNNLGNQPELEIKNNFGNNRKLRIGNNFRNQPDLQYGNNNLGNSGGYGLSPLIVNDNSNLHQRYDRPIESLHEQYSLNNDNTRYQVGTGYLNNGLLITFNCH